MNFLHILTLMFVAAKLLNLISWSWWLVFLPSIIPLAFALTMLIFVGICVAFNK